ncbi:MAG: hypothetical protein ACOH1R_06715 [Luteimonas sp.]
MRNVIIACAQPGRLGVAVSRAAAIDKALVSNKSIKLVSLRGCLAAKDSWRR